MYDFTFFSVKSEVDFDRFKFLAPTTTITAALAWKWAVNHSKPTTRLPMESFLPFWKTSNLVNEKLKQKGLRSFFSQSAG